MTQQDVTNAIEKAREIQDNAQTVADQSRRTKMGASKKPTSNKRKRDALPTTTPSGASVPLTEETLGSTPDETPDPTQQDLPNHKSSAESSWPQRLWFIYQSDSRMDKITKGQYKAYIRTVPANLKVLLETENETVKNASLANQLSKTKVSAG